MSASTTEIPEELVDVDLAEGQRVGEYEVVRKLGQGAFGTVFHAVHPLIGKAVAIKVLARRFSADPEMVSRFVSEARAVNQIRHRHIIDIFSFGQLPADDGRHYYVMEYLDGETLDALLDREKRLPVGDALVILRAIGKALDAAHAKGIAHRDLKAENIFIGRDSDGAGAGYWPKLLDFGIAKLLAPEDGLKHKTRTGAPIGTPYYMSPEQCRGKEVDHRTDLYAFGVLMYLMLTGRYPFDGEGYLDILMQQINDQPAAPSSHVPELPTDVDDVVLWLMNKAPSDRPPDCRTAVRALEEAAVKAGLIAQAATSGDMQTGPTRSPLITPPAGVTRLGSAPPPKIATADTMLPAVPEPVVPVRRSLIPRFAVASLGVLVIAIVVVVMMRGNGDAPTPATAATPAPVAPPPAVTPMPAPPVAPRPVPVDPTPQTVIVSIEGPPEGTEVFGGGMTVGAAPGPVQLPYSKDPIVLTFKADGYLPASRSVVPDRDQTLPITLKKKPVAPVRPTHSHDDILDPFGGRK